ncbi:MAG: Gfo/Idh/MocA family oxidoreductase [Mangrovibacterium sp.]|nr:Gfo/Idh/MocA family oxidoreductase [Mangrovibacterium sp.]
MDIKRRNLIKTGAALGIGVILNPWGTSSMVPSASKRIVRVGFVGIGSRGTSLLKQLLKIGGVEIPAICDINEQKILHIQNYLEQTGRKKPDVYYKSETDFKRLCERNDLDLVITATPWEWHTPVCVAAMEADKPVASEVPIAVTEEECWQLVETSERTGRFCTMLENVSYWKNVMTISKMIHQGVFGEMLHAQVGYQHDIRPGRFNSHGLKVYQETGENHWRIKHHEKYHGNLYPTHALGPVSQWMNINRGDNFSYLVSMETPSRGLNIYAGREYGENHPSAKMRYTHGDVNTTMIKTRKGLTITLYHDVATYRPYDLFLRAQGTEGIYETDKGIYIEGLSPFHKEEKNNKVQWDDFEKVMYSERFKPKLWKEQEENAVGAGHNGGDYMELFRLIEAVRNETEPDIDVYDAASWCVVTELSGRSVSTGSQPVAIPDFTKGAWKYRKADDSVFIM